jgi:hypothetical protein
VNSTENGDSSSGTDSLINGAALTPNSSLVMKLKKTTQGYHATTEGLAHDGIDTGPDNIAATNIVCSNPPAYDDDIQEIIEVSILYINRNGGTTIADARLRTTIAN